MYEKITYIIVNYNNQSGYFIVIYLLNTYYYTLTLLFIFYNGSWEKNTLK